eukprot:scaffold2922_cov1453-Pavlova_lutheri.AAC.1
MKKQTRTMMPPYVGGSPGKYWERLKPEKIPAKKVRTEYPWMHGAPGSPRQGMQTGSWTLPPNHKVCPKEDR